MGSINNREIPPFFFLFFWLVLRAVLLRYSTLGEWDWCTFHFPSWLGAMIPRAMIMGCRRFSNDEIRAPIVFNFRA